MTRVIATCCGKRGELFGQPVEQRFAADIEILQIAGARIAGAGQDEQPGSDGIGAGQQRLQRVEPEKGVDRQRVRRERRVVSDPGLGIGGVGTSDIVAFGIHDHKHAGIDSAAAKLGKHAHAVGALRLEESGLRLDRGHPSLRSLKAGDGKVGNRADRVGMAGLCAVAEQCRHHSRMRINPHAERRAAAADGVCEAGSESCAGHLGHRLRPAPPRRGKFREARPAPGESRGPWPAS